MFLNDDQGRCRMGAWKKRCVGGRGWETQRREVGAVHSDARTACRRAGGGDGGAGSLRPRGVRRMRAPPECPCPHTQQQGLWGGGDGWRGCWPPPPPSDNSLVRQPFSTGGATMGGEADGEGGGREGVPRGTFLKHETGAELPFPTRPTSTAWSGSMCVRWRTLAQGVRGRGAVYN